MDGNMDRQNPNLHELTFQNGHGGNLVIQHQESPGYQRHHVNYQRYPKPPYSYVGLITYAIYMSPEQKLTLAEIKESLEKMFDFFRQEYTGWKDSVRHNLSHNSCFTKGERSKKKDSKGNLWYVNLAKVPQGAFKRQDTVVAKTGNWAVDLHVELNVPEIPLPPRNPVRSAISSTDSGKSTPQSYGYDEFLASDLYECEGESSFLTSNDTEELDEQRYMPPYILDSSMEESTNSNYGPIRHQRSSRKNMRYSEGIGQKDQRALMKMIASTAKSSGVSDDTAAHNLKMLCNVSSLISDTPSHSQHSYHYPPSDLARPGGDIYMQYATSGNNYPSYHFGLDGSWYPGNQELQYGNHHPSSAFSSYVDYKHFNDRQDLRDESSFVSSLQPEGHVYYPLSVQTESTPFTQVNFNDDCMNGPVDYRMKPVNE